ncbi:hypothetical protein B0O80DRAFT_282937 [Mortierella sp. GBAus27b]|nr:hypothetical protein B0O80DRAFT_282937 [Mortierella sp. GBAus27b]
MTQRITVHIRDRPRVASLSMRGHQGSPFTCSTYGQDQRVASCGEPRLLGFPRTVAAPSSATLTKAHAILGTTYTIDIIALCHPQEHRNVQSMVSANPLDLQIRVCYIGAGPRCCPPYHGLRHYLS